MTAPWWEAAVIYQVYPRSFQDSNGDGVGDLIGVTSRLDYLEWLGIDAIWLSPFYPSPMVDFGYDVADYCAVDPLFGTLEDFDALLHAAHARGIKVIVDFVPNHTSCDHPWFKESRSGRINLKRDWYIWRDAKEDGSPPNNWISDFGGPAWTWDRGTSQYYAHAFLPQQPDLNWRNPSVREAMFDVMRFWLDRGVDGFRIDVLWHLIKHADFTDNPINQAFGPGMGEMHKVLQTNSTDQPELMDVIDALRVTMDGYDNDRVMLGEIYLPIDRLVRYYKAGRGVHLPLNFHLIGAEWTPSALAELIVGYEAALPNGAWPNWVMGNHDRSRIAQRLGPRHARLAAVLLMTLRGTPTLYYGDELGLPDSEIARAEVRDPLELRQPGLGLGRDPVRSPMPWDDSGNGGFTTGRPWLPLPPRRNELCVKAQTDNPHSVLRLYRVLIALRRATPVLQIGSICVESCNNGWLIYSRVADGAVVRIALNFGAAAAVPACIVGRRVVGGTHVVSVGRMLGSDEIAPAVSGFIVEDAR